MQILILWHKLKLLLGLLHALLRLLQRLLLAKLLVVHVLKLGIQGLQLLLGLSIVVLRLVLIVGTRLLRMLGRVL